MSDCQPDCRCGEGEPAADPIVWNEVGWEWNGRTYTSIEDAAAARVHPRLVWPHALRPYPYPIAGEEYSAHWVFNVLADAMAAMMKSTSELEPDTPAKMVNDKLAVFSVAFRDLADKVGAAPVDMDGF